MDRDLFGKLVRDALTRLYDTPSLQTHRLARRLPDEQTRALGVGKALRQALVDAIEALRPPVSPATTGASPASRAYQILTLRYLEALDPPQVWARLAISKSHYYAEHQRALDAVISLLWERLSPAAPPAPTPSPAVAPNGAESPAADAPMPVATTEPAWSAPTPAEPTSAPGAPSSDRWVPGNLPLPLTSFVGRAREIADVDALLADSRLVTLSGTGGCGKTRLAIEIAGGLTDRFPDGVWLAELGAVVEPGLVLAAVAAAVGIREQPGRVLRDVLLETLGPKTLLLVLDGCEHVVDDAAALVETLLRACPLLRILATSREPLRSGGEVTYRVPSLAVPTINRPLAPDDLLDVEAARLFVERATAAAPRFAVTPENALIVAQVCVRLDGIPLALELAAARLRGLSIEQLAARLDQRFRLLTDGSRTALPHHQTLRATVDWSYSTLSDAEQRLFERLGLFAGSFTLDAAEAICAHPPPRSAERESGGQAERENDRAGDFPGARLEAGEVLDLLLRLVDKSLVLFEEGEPDAGRYRLLETLRQYAVERLRARGEAAAVGERHAAYYLALAERAEPALFGPDEVAWLDRLEREWPNLQAALAFWQARGNAESALRLICAQLWFWIVRGHIGEGRRRLDDLLRLPALTEMTLTRARALDAAGTLAFYAHDYAAATALHESALAIWRALDDQRGRLSALSVLALIATQERDHARARRYLEESLAIQRAAGDLRGVSQALGALANLAHDQRDYATARRLNEETLAICRQIAFDQCVTVMLHNLALIAYEQGDYPESRARHEEGLAIKRQIGDRRGQTISLLHLADVLLAQADPVAARRALTDCLAIQCELDDKGGIALALERLALLAAGDADHALALTLAGAATTLRESIQMPLPPPARQQHELKLAPARAALGEAAIAAWEAGRSKPLQQVLAELAATAPR